MEGQLLFSTETGGHIFATAEWIWTAFFHRFAGRKLRKKSSRKLSEWGTAFHKSEKERCEYCIIRFSIVVENRDSQDSVDLMWWNYGRDLSQLRHTKKKMRIFQSCPSNSSGRFYLFQCRMMLDDFLTYEFSLPAQNYLFMFLKWFYEVNWRQEERFVVFNIHL